MRKTGAAFIAAWMLLNAAPLAAAERVADDTEVAAGIFLARQWLQNHLDYHRVPGAAVAVVADQETVWSQGFGYARLAGEVPATADTRFSICSVSKLFTSIGVMQLRDSGRLDLDDDIREVLSWYDLPPHAEAEEPVTLRNILSHVAGLPREAVTPYWTEEKFPDRRTLQEGVGAQQPYYRPYEHFQYSNLGMSLAGEAIAAASGEDYHDYIQSRVLGPLGMQHTTSELPVDAYGGTFSAGYRLPGPGGERPEVGTYTLNAIAPAAGFASSANDLARFAKWQFRLLDEGGEEVLKATTLREMQRLQWAGADLDESKWGLGFALSEIDADVWVGHGGYCPGYRTSFLTRPQDSVAVVMMVNVNDVSPAQLAGGVISLLEAPLVAALEEEENEGAGEEAAEEASDAVDLSVYQGVFGRPQMPTRYAIAATSKGLTGINLFSDSPARYKLDLRHERDHVFRVYSRDDEPLDTVRFDIDDSGRAVRMWRHGQYMERLD